VADLEAILDKKRAESAANSGEESGSEYEEIEVTDSEEEVEEEEEVTDSEEEVEEEEEEVIEEEKSSPPVIETPAEPTRKVQPLHPNLPRSAPSDRNRYANTKEIRYTPL
jgi:hypothetical protein